MHQVRSDRTDQNLQYFRKNHMRSQEQSDLSHSLEATSRYWVTRLLFPMGKGELERLSGLIWVRSTTILADQERYKLEPTVCLQSDCWFESGLTMPTKNQFMPWELIFGQPSMRNQCFSGVSRDVSGPGIQI